jgi:tRNA pseudouridine38-40 synthase
MKKTKTRNIKLVIEYDGSDFSGWQVQPGQRTVQDEVEKALYKLSGEKKRVYGAGRTDAGVHALAQAAHFFTSSPIPGDRFSMALNTLLPDDVAIVSSKEMPASFHARRSAMGKHYRYIILNRRVASPLNRKRMHIVYEKLDISRMKKAARQFIGKKNYASFASNAKCRKDPMRFVEEVKVLKKGSVVIIDVKGKSFLYKMVRGIAGTLLEVGKGKELDIKSIFMAKKRKYAGPNLPPEGLYLVKVIY